MTQNIFSSYDVISDLAANRPATPTVANGRLCVFMATDIGDVSVWNVGSASWVLLPTGSAEPTNFTPVLQFGGASTGITYSTQIGRVLKLGKLVRVTINIVLTSKGTATGAATIAGIPYTAENITNEVHIGDLLSNGITYSGTLVAYIQPNDTLVNLGQNTSPTFSSISNTAFSGTDIIRVSLSFISA